ncbi:protein UL91a [Cynomolgus macaque cytomegalovirus strain Mauritius]|uniref:Protein UL91a n=2 Tax=Cytomegalovirus macacinebeta3 TaxID=3050308 RepID=A0A0K1H0E6_9BETA|nr:rhORF6 [macacine betaherpesvirus 3]AKT72906.1 protein UL91a [Cynomolgus macaque cytomegalovirus strain Mauritius]AXG21826.1 protein UL91a [synthetic construct]AXG22093.1 protein UL91a [synthetic construct]
MSNGALLRRVRKQVASLVVLVDEMKMILVVFCARKPRMVLKASFLMKCASSTSRRWKFCPRML